MSAAAREGTEGEMAKTQYGVMVLTEGLAGAGLDTAKAVKLCKGTLIDETEASLTVSVKTEKAATKAVAALVAKGLALDSQVFLVRAHVPDWLEDYRASASAMMEHGG
ncbi:MAG: hypothetical protein AB8H79_24070 [Myxococcota bacterium]